MRALYTLFQVHPTPTPPRRAVLRVRAPAEPGPEAYPEPGPEAYPEP